MQMPALHTLILEREKELVQKFDLKICDILLLTGQISVLLMSESLCVPCGI